MRDGDCNALSNVLGAATAWLLRTSNFARMVLRRCCGGISAGAADVRGYAMKKAFHSVAHSSGVGFCDRMALLEIVEKFIEVDLREDPPGDEKAHNRDARKPFG